MIDENFKSSTFNKNIHEDTFFEKDMNIFNLNENLSVETSKCVTKQNSKDIKQTVTKIRKNETLRCSFIFPKECFKEYWLPGQSKLTEGWTSAFNEQFKVQVSDKCVLTLTEHYSKYKAAGRKPITPFICKAKYKMNLCFRCTFKIVEPLSAEGDSKVEVMRSGSYHHDGNDIQRKFVTGEKRAFFEAEIVEKKSAKLCSERITWENF